MSDDVDERRPNLVAILACNDLDASERWWNRLGFHRPADQNYEGYRMLSDGDGCELHLTNVAEAGWLVPGKNPNGVYLYTPRVDALAATMRDEIIEKAKAPEHKPWGMYELSLNGPDDFLVRIGWPSRLCS
ncbi:MAG TPA: hypothetical protein VGM90_04690 [Kofleriaceae bacterium]|jgi:hypothetical protein